MVGELVTSCHPVGYVQVRVRRRARRWRLLLALTIPALLAAAYPILSGVLLVAAGLELSRGWRNTGRRVRQLLQGGDRTTPRRR